MNRILIVEDEADLASVLKDYLTHHGFEVSVIADGALAFAEFERFSPALILLDLMLPNKDGLDICKQIRALSSVPIIMVTAKVEEIDRLLGLELGADDYVCKPYSPREVVARVKAVLRRTSAQNESIAANQLLILDEPTMSANYDGHSLNLTAVEFRLLKTMASEPRRIFSREQLMDRIYSDYRVVHDRTIDSHINKLRKKLAAVSSGDDIVRSVYGVGYKYEEPC